MKGACSFIFSTRRTLVCDGVRRHKIKPSFLPSRLFSDLDDLMDQVLTDPTIFDKADKTPLNSSGNWRTYDWTSAVSSSKSQGNSTLPLHKPSPVDVMVVQDRMIYVKRDDQLRLQGSQISGNKARKMFALNQLSSDEFPQCVVSYGGPQSNAMLALAAIVHFQNQTRPTGAPPRRFVYYTKKLPKFLRKNPSGNLFRAQTLGMEMVELLRQEYNDLFGSDWGGSGEPPLAIEPPVPGESLYVPQGGASGTALAGTRRLAEEVISFWKDRGQGRPLTICLPGGTCSTAVLLHNAITGMNSKKELDIQVVVIPCVGDEFYANRQMTALNAELGSSNNGIPTVLPPIPDDPAFTKKNPNIKNQYFSFGEPHPAILDTYNSMKDELVLDLLYGAPSWTILLRHLNVQGKSQNKGGESSFDPIVPFDGRSIMYIHSGGLEGINTQLLRYKYKGLIELDDIQLPGTA